MKEKGPFTRQGNKRSKEITKHPQKESHTTKKETVGGPHLPGSNMSH